MSEHPADEPGRPEAAGGEAARGADPEALHAGAEPPSHADDDQATGAQDGVGDEAPADGDGASAGPAAAADEAWAGPAAAADGASAGPAAAGDETSPGQDAAGGEQDELAIARRRLAEVADLPVEEHAPVYEDVHRSLQDALAEAGREREPDGVAGPGSGADPRARDDGARDR